MSDTAIARMMPDEFLGEIHLDGGSDPIALHSKNLADNLFERVHAPASSF